MSGKRKIFVLGILVLLLIAGGFFWWWKKEKGPSSVFEAIKFEPLENYVVKETPEGKIVENVHAGLEFKVPTGWNVKKITGPQAEEDYRKFGVSIFSTDMEIDPETKLPRSGCNILIKIEYRPSERKFQVVKNLINEVQRTTSEEKKKRYEVIIVDGYQALKETLFDDPKAGEDIYVQVPIGEKIYIFETILVPKDKDRCFHAFDEFLKTVSIK